MKPRSKKMLAIYDINGQLRVIIDKHLLRYKTLAEARAAQWLYRGSGDTMRRVEVRPVKARKP
jgi:hypothetical protein